MLIIKGKERGNRRGVTEGSNVARLGGEDGFDRVKVREDVAAQGLPEVAAPKEVVGIFFGEDVFPVCDLGAGKELFGEADGVDGSCFAHQVPLCEHGALDVDHRV